MSDEPHPEWIERVVKLAAAVGMNPTRVRWKLIRWQESRRRGRRRLEQKLDHVRYVHKTCASCGAVQDRDAVRCSSCGVKLGGRVVQTLRRVGLVTPQAWSVSTLLALAIMAVYTRVFVAQGGGFGAPSGWLLFDFGAQWEIGSEGEPWRLVTAMFLHIGMWHLAFNLIAIATVGPQIESVYGRLTMLFVFIATGVLANVGSGLVQPEVLSAGASGGLCGLIGAAAGYGHRLGTGAGRTLRNDMLKWIAYTIVFGFALHANNWAHAFGAITGAAFGYTVPPRVWARRALAPVRAAAKLVGMVATVGAVVIIFTRTPHDHRETTGDDEVVADYRFAITACRIASVTPDAGAAQKLLDFRHAVFGDNDLLAHGKIETLCTSLFETRDQCKAGSLDRRLAGTADWRRVCDLIERAFADVDR